MAAVGVFRGRCSPGLGCLSEAEHAEGERGSRFHAPQRRARHAQAEADDGIGFAERYRRLDERVPRALRNRKSACAGSARRAAGADAHARRHRRAGSAHAKRTACLFADAVVHAGRGRPIKEAHRRLLSTHPRDLRPGLASGRPVMRTPPEHAAAIYRKHRLPQGLRWIEKAHQAANANLFEALAHFERGDVEAAVAALNRGCRFTNVVSARKNGNGTWTLVRKNARNVKIDPAKEYRALMSPLARLALRRERAAQRALDQNATIH